MRFSAGYTSRGCAKRCPMMSGAMKPETMCQTVSVVSLL
jgi:hypothetical protein